MTDCIGGERRDPRIRVDERYSSGVRGLGFAEDLQGFREDTFCSVSLKGPRSFRKTTISVRDGTQTGWNEFQIKAFLCSVISEKASLSPEHSFLCVLLRMLQSHN